MRLDGIQAVTFDAGGTLIEPWPSVGHVYAEVAAKHGEKSIDPEILNRRFGEAWRARQDFGYTRAEWVAIVDETFGGSVAVPPSGSFFPELYERFTEVSAWRVFEDVKPALAMLAKRGLRLGVISNWDERLRPLLERLGLARAFEVITVSCEVGHTKPSAEIFQKSASKFGLTPGHILHVGDSFREDVAGAQRAGFKGVQLVRGTATSTYDRVNSLLQIA